MFVFLIIFFSIVFESFPISSSGHIFLLKQYMYPYYKDISALVLDDIDYLVHGATAIVSALFFGRRWIKYVKTLPRSLPMLARLIVLGFIAESATLACYMLFSFVTIRMSLLGSGFIVTSCALYSLRYCSKYTRFPWQWSDALILGCAQGIALLPGISRFGLTFAAARWLGFAPLKALETSFLLLWPINIAACVWGLIKLHQHHSLDILNFSAVFIMIIASGVSLLCFYGISRLINADKLWIFSGYALVLASIVMMLR